MTAKTKPSARFEHKTFRIAEPGKREQGFNHFTRKTIHRADNQTVIRL
jgi:hypothetical protein